MAGSIEEEEEEEERLFQMVHDFIESGQSSSSSSSISTICCNSSSKCLSLHHHHHHHQSTSSALKVTTSSALKEILRSGSTEEEEAEREVLESVMKHMIMLRREGAQKSSGLMNKLLVLSLQMDGFNASLCQTSWHSSFGCPAGDYEYIDIIIKNKNEEEDEAKRVIVDIDFRSQFEVARPTQSYKELTDTLPSIFVGSEEKLKRVISLLCSSAKQSLKERGLHIPPWRTSTYMHSKWQKHSPNGAISANGHQIQW